MKKSWKRKRALCSRVTALAAAVAVLVGAAMLPGTPNASAAKTKEQMEAEIAQIEARIEERQEEIDKLKKEAAEQEKILPVLAAQVKEYESKIAVIDDEIAKLNASVKQLRTRIAGLNTQIAECEAAVERIQSETETAKNTITGMQEQLKARLRQQYMEGPSSGLQLLLSSPDLTSFLTMAEFIRKQAERDAALRRTLETQMAELLRLEARQKEQQGVLEASRAELQQEEDTLALQMQEQKRARRSLDEQHDRVSAAQSELFGIIGGLERKTAEAQRLIAADEKAAAELERKIDKLLQEKKNSAGIKPDNLPVAEGVMIWPLPYENCYVTSEFGSTDVSIRSGAHQGIDMSAPGANSKDYYVQAALAGEVIDCGYNSSKGNYVVIYHGYYEPKGKEIRTTYMHLRRINEDVEVGVKMKAGKILGVMGTTGNSTGTHLHFQINEIYSDGSSKPVNPRGYVKNPYG
jgi:murein DD-endopeptidase MepM/ murein hydrolase activator NlpD